MRSNNRRILVTGGSGFTGSYLLPLLRQAEYEIVRIERPGEGVADGDVVVAGDLLDGEILSEAVAHYSPDTIIHLAAISYAGHADLTQMYLTNILGTRKLLAAAATAPRPPRLLMASSGGIYRPDITRRLDEDSPVAPGNDYMLTKYAGELLADQYRYRLSIRVVRPFNYSGPGQSKAFVVPKIVAAFRNRDPFIRLGNLDVQRDFCDVRDVATAYAGLVGCPGDTTVNICSGVTISPREIIETLKAQTGHSIEVEVDAALVRRGEPERLAGHNARLRTLLPAWSPRPFVETLAFMLAGGEPAE